jgi:hypothetical protein
LLAGGAFPLLNERLAQTSKLSGAAIELDALAAIGYYLNGG